jgi:hypothetical protein
MVFDLADPPRVVRTPRWPLVAAVVCAVLAASATLLAADDARLALAGYVLGGLLLPALTALHRFVRRSASKDPYFIPEPFLQRVMAVALCAGVLAGAVNAWYIATEVAKQ